jgi:hypothetical protein
MNIGGVRTIQSCPKSIAPSTTLIPTPPVLSFVVSKLFGTAGQNARYLFEITALNELNYLSNIFVHFPNNISPKLNSRDGNAECKIDNL